MDTNQLRNDARIFWDGYVLEALRRHIEIPAKSVGFDAQWHEHGHITAVVENARTWAQLHAPEGTSIEVISDGKNASGEFRTPALVIDVPATGGCEETVLLYGHLDKQPEFEGWDASAGLEPWKAVDVHGPDGHRLYGRGGADDGYAGFAALTSILCLEEQEIPHARCVILLETGEESGSPDLPFYLELLRSRIGTPSLIIALDSGCGTYDRLWLTTSLRGIVYALLEVQVLTQGVHSGDAGGIVPDSFQIIRRLLDRIEDSNGDIKLPELHAVIPELVHQQARIAGHAMGPDLVARFPWVIAPEWFPTDLPGWQYSERLHDVILARTWQPSLTVTGADGLPSIKDAGNTLRPMTRLKLSIRIPPTVDCERAAQAVQTAIEQEAKNIPACSICSITCNVVGRPSWTSPIEAEWLTKAVDDASWDFFGREAVRMGEGGAIPFMAQLSQAYPNAQFVITGVLGPGSNAHGPNEFIHVDYAKNVTASIAHILWNHARHFAK